MSRDDPTYSRVSSKFWPEAKNNAWTDDMVTLGLYLLTCQQRTTEGLYRLPKGYMVEDLPGCWTDARLTASLDALVAQGFCDYDEKARVVFLPKAMKYQRPDNKNQQTAAIRNVKSLPPTRLSGPFFEAAKLYCEGFHKALCQAFPQGLGQGIGNSPALLSSISTPNSAAPVDNSSPVDNSAETERGCSIEQAEPDPDPPTDTEPVAAPAVDVANRGDSCDGHSCTVREFDASAVGPLKRAILASDHPDAWHEYGTGGKLDDQLKAYAECVCRAAQAAFAEYERPQRWELCRAALVAAVESLHGSKDVGKVLASRIVKEPDMLALIGDRKLEELRRTRRAKRPRCPEQNPVRVGEVLAGVRSEFEACEVPS